MTNELRALLDWWEQEKRKKRFGGSNPFLAAAGGPGAVFGSGSGGSGFSTVGSLAQIPATSDNALASFQPAGAAAPQNQPAFQPAGVLYDGSGENGQSPSADPDGPNDDGGQVGGTPGQSSGVNSAGDVGGQMGPPGVTAAVASGLASLGPPGLGFAVDTGLAVMGHPQGRVSNALAEAIAPTTTAVSQGLVAARSQDPAAVGIGANDQGHTSAGLGMGPAPDSNPTGMDSMGNMGLADTAGFSGGPDAGGGNTGGTPGPDGVSGTDAAGNAGLADGGPAGSGPAGGGEGGTGCYITEATVTHGGEADDGETLSALRTFRDGVMMRTPEGRREVAAYREGAPAIVEGINAREDAEDVYRFLRESFIRPAAEAIKAGDNEKAHELYAELVQAADLLGKDDGNKLRRAAPKRQARNRLAEMAASA